MIIIKSGDILKAEENLICHQVNIQGQMAGGLALQVANQYPNVEREYKRFCDTFKSDEQFLVNQYQAVSIGEKKYIINCFSQKSNFDTDYEAIEIIFNGLLESCKRNNFTIAVPYRYGSGIANGDWNKIKDIFEKLSSEYKIDINIYKLEESL